MAGCPLKPGVGLSGVVPRPDKNQRPRHQRGALNTSAKLPTAGCPTQARFWLEWGSFPPQKSKGPLARGFSQHVCETANRLIQIKYRFQKPKAPLVRRGMSRYQLVRCLSNTPIMPSSLRGRPHGGLSPLPPLPHNRDDLRRRHSQLHALHIQRRRLRLPRGTHLTPSTPHIFSRHITAPFG